MRIRLSMTLAILLGVTSCTAVREPDYRTLVSILDSRETEWTDALVYTGSDAKYHYFVDRSDPDVSRCVKALHGDHIWIPKPMAPTQDQSLWRRCRLWMSCWAGDDTIARTGILSNYGWVVEAAEQAESTVPSKAAPSASSDVR